MEIKILHTADIQVNVRGRHLCRKVEYGKMMDRILSVAKDFGPDLIIIAGDVYEKWDANADERDIITKFLHDVGKLPARAIIVPGNHDLLQSNFDYDPGDGTRADLKNALEEQLSRDSFGHVTYLDKTGFFDMGPIVVANWSHKSKYTVEENQPYSPWAMPHKKDKSKFYIDLFHDPIKDCFSWDGQVLRGANGDRVDKESFKGDLVLMGDIHKPGVYTNKAGVKAVYPSSPVIRDFSEGDYYDNLKIAQEGNLSHGVNLVTVDTDMLEVSDMEFVALKQYQAVHTINMDNDFPKAVEGFSLANVGDTNKVKINFNIEKAGGIECLQAFIKHLHEKHTISNIDVNYSQSVQSDLSLLKNPISNDELHDKGFLKEVAKEYAYGIFPEDRFADTDKRVALAGRLYGLLGDAIDRLDTEQPRDSIEIGKLCIKNFTSFADTSIDFGSLPNLVKILGNNGTGKTNILRAIKWLGTDRICAQQKQNKKRSAALDMFNDKLAEDFAEVSLEIKLNEKNYRISRSLRRDWKDETQRGQKDWKLYVNKVYSEFTVTDQGTGAALDPAVSENIRARVFGDYFEFVDMHIINQAFLDDIVSRDSDKLIEWLLWHIGLNYFTELQKSYDHVKTALFDGLSKPGINMQSAEIAIQSAAKALGDHINKFADVETRLAKAKDAKKTADTKIEFLQRQYVEFDENDLKCLKLSPELLESNIKNTKETLAKTTLKIAQISDALKESAENETAQLANITKIKLDIQKASGKFDLLQTNIGNISANTAHKQDAIDNIIDGHNRRIADNIKSFEQSVLDKGKLLESSKNNLSILNESVLKSHNDGLLNKRIAEQNKHETLKTKHKTVRASLDNDINKKIKQFLLDKKTLESNVCPACAQPLKNDDAVKNLKALNGEIAALKEKGAGYENALAALDVSMASAVSKIKELEACAIPPERLADALPGMLKNDPALSAKYGIAMDSVKKARHEYDTALAARKKISEMGGRIPESMAQQINKLRAEKEELIKTASGLIVECDLCTKGRAKTQELYNVAEAEYEKTRAGKVKLEGDKNSEELIKTKSEKHLAHLGSYLIKLESLVLQDARNKELDIELNKARFDQNTASGTLNDCQKTITKHEVTKTGLARDLSDAKNIIGQIEAWSDAEAVDKYYRDATGKKGLQKQVFDRVVLSINTKLSALLSSTNFKVMFDITDNYALKMIDLLGRESVRPMYLASGMEGTLPALILVILVKSMKTNKNLGWLWVDEITGKINSGEDTKGDDSINKDYQDITFNLLEEVSSHCKIMIIDHVIDNNRFKHRINVVKDVYGCAAIGA